jgi:flagellar basal body-associated protein FliL
MTSKAITTLVLLLAASAAAVGAFMWWKTKKKTEAATQEVRNQTAAPKPADGGLAPSDFDPTSGSSKYGSAVREAIDAILN